MKRFSAPIWFAVLLAPATAVAAPSKLFIQEIVVSPTEAETIAIQNPGASAVDLSNYYLADYNSYYNVALQSGAVDSADFLVRFPAGASIQGGEKQYISIGGAECFKTACGTTGGYLGFGVYPSYEFVNATATKNSASVPDMLPGYTGSVGASRGLTNTGEPVILFYWDGTSNLVVDIDYVYYANSTAASNAPVNKTNITVKTSTYLPDTADVVANHAPLSATATYNTCRISSNENQKASGSNGLNGTDETSENLSVTFTACGSVNPSGSDAGVGGTGGTGGADGGVDASAGGTGGTATGGTGGVTTGGTGGTATGGTGGTATGGTGGVTTGGTGGTATGGVAGSSTGGVAGSGTGGVAGSTTGGAGGVTSGGTGGAGFGGTGAFGGGTNFGGTGNKPSFGGFTGNKDGGADAGPGGGSSDSGCGCHAVGQTPTGGEAVPVNDSRLALAGLVAALGLVRRRRRISR